MLSGNSLRQTVHTHHASVYQAAKLVAAFLRVARVTAGLAESNCRVYDSGHLQANNRYQLRFGTLCSVIEHELQYLYLYLFTAIVSSNVRLLDVDISLDLSVDRHVSRAFIDFVNSGVSGGRRTLTR